MAPTKRGHKDHLIDDPDTDTDDDDYPPKKPTAIPEDWKSRCFADHHWCKHFLLSLYVNNMLDKIPGLSFVPPTMSPSQKEAIKEECKGNEKCIWKKTKKWDDKNIMPKLLQEALAGGGGGGGSSNGGHTTNKGRSGSQSNLALIVTVAVASGVISFLLLLLLIYCCCCSGKRNKSPKSNVRINNVTLHSSKKSKKRPKSSTKKRLSFKSKSAKKSSRKSQKSSKKKPQFEIQVQ